MARPRRSIRSFLEADPDDWTFVAILGTRHPHTDSAYKVYLKRKSTHRWYRVECGWPTLGAHSRSPHQYYPRGFLHVGGTMRQWPQWLKWMERRVALNDLAQFATSISHYTVKRES